MNVTADSTVNKTYSDVHNLPKFNAEFTTYFLQCEILLLCKSCLNQNFQVNNRNKVTAENSGTVDKGLEVPGSNFCQWFCAFFVIQ